MTSTNLLALSFGLFLASLPLISFGAMQEMDSLWMAGLVLIAVAGVIPPAERFLVSSDDDGPGRDES